MSEIMKLTLKRTEVPVSLEGTDGLDKAYILRELSGSERDKFLNQMRDKMKFGKDGSPSGVKTFDGLQAGLLALCLYDDANVLVPIKDIQEFPSSTLDALFQKAQHINALDKAGEEEAKND